MKNTVRMIALVLAMVLMTGCTLLPSKDSTKSYTCRDLTMDVPAIKKLLKLSDSQVPLLNNPVGYAK